MKVLRFSAGDAGDAVDLQASYAGGMRAPGGKSEREFLLRTRNYEGKAVPRISECKK